jgi:hypothetical protein
MFEVRNGIKTWMVKKNDMGLMDGVMTLFMDMMVSI